MAFEEQAFSLNSTGSAAIRDGNELHNKGNALLFPQYELKPRPLMSVTLVCRLSDYTFQEKLVRISVTGRCMCGFNRLLPG